MCFLVKSGQSAAEFTVKDGLGSTSEQMQQVEKQKSQRGLDVSVSQRFLGGRLTENVLFG